MKKIALLLLFCGFAKLQAQTTTIQGMEVDFRIVAELGDEKTADLVKTAPAEVKKLNHYYSKSFIYVKSTDPNAEAYDLSTVNVKRFEDQRLQNERKTIVVSANNDMIILKSKEELEKEYLQIK
jgi:hypothetical protein